MDERDAKLGGYTVVRREMAFVDSFVTCTNCGCNYDYDSNPRFCQAFSNVVDPDATKANEATAQGCKQWVPKGLNRNMVVHPDHRYHYED